MRPHERTGVQFSEIFRVRATQRSPIGSQRADLPSHDENRRPFPPTSLIVDLVARTPPLSFSPPDHSRESQRVSNDDVQQPKVHRNRLGRPSQLACAYQKCGSQSCGSPHCCDQSCPRLLLHQQLQDGENFLEFSAGHAFRRGELTRCI